MDRCGRINAKEKERKGMLLLENKCPENHFNRDRIVPDNRCYSSIPFTKSNVAKVEKEYKVYHYIPLGYGVH